MRENVNLYPAQADAQYDGLRAAIGGRPVRSERWIARRDARRESRASWRRRIWWRRAATA